VPTYPKIKVTTGSTAFHQVIRNHQPRARPRGRQLRPACPGRRASTCPA
jgi:hypothetical protein